MFNQIRFKLGEIINRNRTCDARGSSMVSINLLPWRELQKKYENRLFKKILISLMVTLLILFSGIYFFLYYNIGILQERVSSLSAQYNEHSLNDDQEKPNMINSGKYIFPLIEALSQPYTEKVCFKNIINNNDFVILTGISRSAIDLTEFLLHFAAGNFFAKIEVLSMKQTVSSDVQFSLRAIKSL
jgi:Tfp pilus assembly protein PilN